MITISPTATERIPKNWIDGAWADAADHGDSFDRAPGRKTARNGAISAGGG